MNGYELSRIWFDWCFENQEKIKPNHTALYFFCIEHCNRMGWVKKFGLPTTMAKSAIGIASYNTFINTLNDLVEWGFIEMIQKSQNQYTSNIIALSNNDKALDKALDKAMINHVTKQSETTGESISSINKQDNNKQKTIDRGAEAPQPTIPLNKKTLALRKAEFRIKLKPYVGQYPDKMLKEFHDYWTEPNRSQTKMRFELEPTYDIKLRLIRWANNDKSIESDNSNTGTITGDIPKKL